MAVEEIKYFMFPDIPRQKYPTHIKSESGKIINLRAMIDPPKKRGAPRYSRVAQLGRRSLQAKIFDALIQIKYWYPLEVLREFPIIIRNSKRLPGQSGAFYLLDYYFPELKLAVELDSDLHDGDRDEVRDEYLLKTHGIETFRIRDFHKPEIQSGQFQDLVAKVKKMKPNHDPETLTFTD